MALFAVEYTYSDSTAAARDEHRPKHRAWLSGHVDDHSKKIPQDMIDALAKSKKANAGTRKGDSDRCGA